MLAQANKPRVAKIVNRASYVSGVEIKSCVNVGNHLHFMIKFSNRLQYRKFIRMATGLLARFLLKAEKGEPKLRNNERFFDKLPFTRILSSWREIKNLNTYFYKNELEARGGKFAREWFEATLADKKKASTA